MIDNRQILKKIKRLSSRFWGGRPWYQCIDFAPGISTEPYTRGKARQRSDSFLQIIPDYVNSHDCVLDLGCNAGLFTLSAAQICRKAIGVEIDKAFYRQALFVKEIFSLQGKRVDNVEIRLCNILDNLELLDHATVVFASKVLYHRNLVNGLFNLMQAIKFSPARLILLQGHVTQGKIGQNQGMQALLEQYGFSFKLVNNDPEYSIVVGQRTY